MNKTIKNKTIKNKTIKNKTISNPTNKFILNIMKEWKNQTNGFVQKDKKTINDYYLSFSNTSDYDNHIHLHSKKHTNSYMMKKYDIHNKKIIHSKPIIINRISTPKAIVQDMIQNYNHFINKQQ